MALTFVSRITHKFIAFPQICGVQDNFWKIGILDTRLSPKAKERRGHRSPSSSYQGERT